MTTAEQINVTLKNCNNIDHASILLFRNNLNLRYALNGTGKTTISKAILLHTRNSDLNALKPFGSSETPYVEFSQPIHDVLVFNDEFIDSVVFKESEVIENSFEVFIKTPEYEERVNTLNQKLSALKIGIQENENLLELTNILDLFAQKLKLNNDGSIKNDAVLKSLTAKENIFKIPAELEIFKPFLQNNDVNIDWVDWKTKGENFDSIAGCPFCTNQLAAEYPEQKKLFQQSYKKASTKNLKEMLDLVESLKTFMSTAKYNLLVDCIKKETDTHTIIQEITKLRAETEGIARKIGDMLRFNKLDIKREEISQIGELLRDLKISVAGIDYLSSDKAKSIYNDLNGKIEELEGIVDELKKEIGAFMGFVISSINNAKEDVNLFLQTAGINYELEIVQNGAHDSVRTILRHIAGNNKHDVGKIKDHLSWGEKNAFSLVLFMHYALSRDADLIILDDPISSFDKNKKYAIINRLFGKHPLGKSFFKKTVLMLSHDFEPVIDFVINNKPTGASVNAEYFWNRNGAIESKPLHKTDICSWTTLLKKYAKDETKCIINRLAFFRKYIELNKDSKDADAAYHIISSLQHGDRSAKIKTGDNFQDMSPTDYEEGLAFIKCFIANFDYAAILSDISNESRVLTYYKEQENNYYKIQIFRLLLELMGKRSQIQDNGLLKFIDETYHIENDYLYFLNIEKYNIIPEHIIRACDLFLSKPDQSVRACGL